MLLIAAAMAQDFEIAADRPGYADGTTTVPFKHVQIEMGLNIAIPSLAIDAPGILLRGGITDQVELRLGPPSIAAGYSSVAGPVFVASGGWYLGSKIAFEAGEATFSLVPAVSAPVLTNLQFAGTMDVALGFNWAYDLDDTFGLSGNVLGTLSPIGKMEGDVSGSVAIGASVDRFGFFGEGIVGVGNDGAGVGAGAGLTVLTTSREQYDLSVTSMLVGPDRGLVIGAGYARLW